MIFTAIAFMVWIPAILGIGELAHFLYRRAFAVPYRAGILENAILGLAIISAVANWLNFFVPISLVVQGIILAIGWGGLIPLLRHKESHELKPIGVIGAVTWAVMLIFWRAHITPDHYDTGSYSLQNLYWYQTSSLPLGLANLNARFAYNLSWLALASVVSLPGVDYFVSGEIFLWFMGWMTLSAIQDGINRPLTPVRLYGLLIPLVFLTPVLGTLTLSSLATDLPVFWLCITLGWVSLRLITHELPLSYGLWFTLILSCFAITIKLSAMPVFFISLTLLLILDNSARKHLSQLLKAVLPVALFMVLPWLVRFFWMSGCLVYPVSFTCSDAVQWGVGKQAAQWMANYIQQFAINRTPIPTDIALLWFLDSHLFQDWLALYFGYPETFVVLFSLILGALIYWASYKRRPVHRKPRQEVSLILSYAGAIVFWFWTAPDVRFGSGYLWTVTLLFFSWGIFYLLHEQEMPIRNLAYAFLFAMLIGLTSVAWIRVASSLLPSPLSIHWVWPAQAPRVPTWEKNIDGISIRSPQKSDLLCWGEPLPCTPELHPELRIKTNETGDIEMFYVPGLVKLYP